jgi:hypothetical protein
MQGSQRQAVHGRRIWLVSRGVGSVCLGVRGLAVHEWRVWLVGRGVGSVCRGFRRQAIHEWRVWLVGRGVGSVCRGFREQAAAVCHHNYHRNLVRFGLGKSRPELDPEEGEERLTDQLEG